MALSASAKDYLSRFFPGPPSPLWETDPEFMELFANFALDEVVNQGDLDDAARMMAILAALLGCQGVEEYRVLLPAALRAGITPVQVKEILYQSVAYLGIGRVRPFFSVTNQVLTEQGVALPLKNKVKDKANAVKENIKDMPTQTAYAVYSAKKKAKSSVSDFKRGMVQEQQIGRAHV